MVRWRKSRIVLLYTALSLLLIAATLGCTQNNGKQQAEKSEHSQEEQIGQEAPDHSNHPQEPDVPENPPEPPKPVYKEAKLIAVGDIMMHLPQTRSGYDPESGTYQFDHFFTEVRERLSAGNWVIGNLETPLADNDKRGYTGYPEFNAPPELADALVHAGFNIVTTANNHSLDRRESGLIRTLENVRDRGLTAVGTAASAEEAQRIAIVTHEEIAMAILAYTYGTNGIPVPEGKSYLVNLIDEEKIIADIRKARELKADVVTVALHFGNEYQSEPSKEQIELVQTLFKSGADIILGSHPHVLQPYEVVEVTRDDGSVKQGVVIYSMGNFISNQDRFRNNNHPTEIGVIFEVGIRKQLPGGEIAFTGIEAIPTYVHKRAESGKTIHRVLPLETVLTAKADEYLTANDYERIHGYYEEALARLESMLPKQTAGATP